MIDILKLKGKLVEKNITQNKLSELLKINPSTVNKKINDSSGMYWSLYDIEQLIDILGLNSKDLISIFFDKKLEYSQERF